jgi:hypothetical protein
MEEKMLKIKKNLKVAQDRQKNYADKNKTHREFNVGDHVFLKVTLLHMGRFFHKKFPRFH